MQTIDHLDIERFMGSWYVIASIPTFAEQGIIDPIETYRLNDDGTIETRFSFSKRAGGPRREIRARGFVRESGNNAVWGMQFIWPIKADYRVVYLDADYRHTIIGRVKRDYLWIMSRQAPLDAEKLRELIDLAVGLGYDKSKIQLSTWQLPLEEAV